MSLTSYRAAPPRDKLETIMKEGSKDLKIFLFIRLVDLAASYSPAS
jgi:hypothetical protein